LREHKPKKQNKVKLPTIKLPKVLKENIGIIILILILVGIFAFPKCEKEEAEVTDVFQETADDLGEYRNMTAKELLALLDEGREIKELVVREFDIFAEKWYFSPNEITVNAGELVKLNIKAVDINHSIRIPMFFISEELPYDEVVTVSFLAKRPGRFIFESLENENMRGTIVVEDFLE